MGESEETATFKQFVNDPFGIQKKQREEAKDRFDKRYDEYLLNISFIQSPGQKGE